LIGNFAREFINFVLLFRAFLGLHFKDPLQPDQTFRKAY